MGGSEEGVGPRDLGNSQPASGSSPPVVLRSAATSALPAYPLLYSPDTSFSDAANSFNAEAVLASAASCLAEGSLSADARSLVRSTPILSSGTCSPSGDQTLSASALAFRSGESALQLPPAARAGLGFLATDGFFPVEVADAFFRHQEQQKEQQERKEHQRTKRQKDEEAWPVSSEGGVSGTEISSSSFVPKEPASPPPQTLELLECSVCFDRMQPPIFQCNEGHTLCDQCHKKVKSCPMCRSSILNIRCRALEKLAQNLLNIPCRYKTFGCSHFLKYAELPEHEMRCAFRPLRCLHGETSCNFEGHSFEVVQHLMEKHGYECRETNIIHFVCKGDNFRRYAMVSGDKTQIPCDVTEQRATLPPGSDSYVWQQQIYSCVGNYFILRVHRCADPANSMATFYILLVALSSKHHCCRYSLKVAGNHRVFTFEGPVWSALKCVSEVERVNDCMVLPENMALFLSGARGSEPHLSDINLTVTGEIFLPPTSR